jgi:hypothetical protein
MNYQPSQPTSTITRSVFSENLHQHKSQQYPPSLHRTAPHQFSSPATSLSLPQVGCSVMHLQSPTRPQSPPNTRQSLEPLATESEAPTNRPWQIVKKRKRTHPPVETATRGHQSPFDSPNQFEELSHLSDDDIPTPASAPHVTISSEQATQLRAHKPPPVYVRIWRYKLSCHGEIPY